MAKLRRQTAKAAASKTPAKRRRPKAAASAADARATRASKSKAAALSAAYAKAIGLYEKALKAMQRRKFDAGATAFRQLIDQYPDERELHERARVYLAVCERELSPSPKPPRGAEDRILAATVALNRRDVDEALTLLRSAAASDSRHDYVQYMLALAHAQRADAEAAGRHLSKAISLNPQNRINAQHEADFDAIREDQFFLDALETP
jgi:tetratricopeptide (TPR) repeat protein